MSMHFDKDDPWHESVWFLLELWCWQCLARIDEEPDWGPTGESLQQYCVDVTERAKSLGWVMSGGQTYCPNCAAKGQIV
jgi:hypothetical protein